MVTLKYKIYVDVLKLLLPLGTHNNNIFLFLLFKVRFASIDVKIVSGFKSLTESRYVTIADKDVFINQVVNRLPSFSDSYQTNPIDQLVFNYIIRDGEPNDETRKLVNNREENTGSNFRIGDLN